MKRTIIGFILVMMLLFPVVLAASGSMEIIDMGSYYDGEAQYGYVDYTNTANHNASGALLVFIDGKIIAGEILDMPIRYVAGFRCSPVKTLEFSLRTTKGDHAIIAYVISQNSTVQHGYEYTMDGWEEEQDEEEIEEREKEDWLKCP